MNASQNVAEMALEGYSVDLKWQPDAGLGSILVGQVLDMVNGPVAAIPLLLVAGGEVVDRAMTCRSGQFQARGGVQDISRNECELYVMVNADNCLKLTVPAAGDWVM